MAGLGAASADVEDSKEEEVVSEAVVVVLLEVLMKAHSLNKNMLTVVLQKLSTILAPLLSVLVFQTRRPVPAPAQEVHQLVQRASEADQSLNHPVKQTRMALGLLRTLRPSDF